MSDKSLEEARILAREIYSHHYVRRKAMDELRGLSDDAKTVLERLIEFHIGKSISVNYALDDLISEPRLKRLSFAMAPLVKWWEESNGPITTTLYSNPKQTDKYADDGASRGLKWLAKEMSEIVDGSKVTPRAVLTMLEHIRR